MAISAPLYRLKLQSALREVDALKRKTPPRPLGKIVKKFDNSFAVRRADGQVQSVAGDFWSNFVRWPHAPQNTSRSDIQRARGALQAQIRALDEWQSVPRYQHVDAQKIVAGLETSGQIRVGPLWWQKMLSDAWGAVVRTWDAFIKWLNGLFPRPTTPNIKTAPIDKWLWILFYVFVAALLSVVLWFLWRAFGGKWSKKSVKVSSDLQGEDAELLLLPPAELLSRAQQFAAAGNFREALRHRYLSLLLDLDARGVWRYDARRTNWEHIANLRRTTFARELIAPLSALTRRFDRVRYGGAPCDDEGWRRFDVEARDFEIQAASGQKIAPSLVSEPATRGAEVVR
ncbi:DUF4129 domain-containing protein [Abditibacterium utsteinense]|uniref:DUF4129 domain-containing protein n=1 Tax=Abditibacterium utsteinense TaxID=1960156 RepID=UPI0013007B5B|nr:DUF4129 domain-containing protein [Abditibacterium utsteinense]